LVQLGVEAKLIDFVSAFKPALGEGSGSGQPLPPARLDSRLIFGHSVLIASARDTRAAGPALLARSGRYFLFLR
jgi:hypothetical protein